MLLLIVAATCLLAVHAVPLGRQSDGILEDMVDGPRSIGRLLGGHGSSMNNYERRGRLGSSNGFIDQGYEREGGSHAHDSGHLEHDYRKIEESHTSSGHAIGRDQEYGSRGHQSEGHSSFGAGEDAYGRRDYNRLGHGI